MEKKLIFILIVSLLAFEAAGKEFRAHINANSHQTPLENDKQEVSLVSLSGLAGTCNAASQYTSTNVSPFSYINLRIVNIYCQGSVPGTNWLNGLTQSSQVALAPNPAGCNPTYSGTLWRFHVVDPINQIVNLECLGNVAGTTWLQATSSGGVALTASQTDPGTQWTVTVNGGSWNFQSSSNGQYLNGLTTSNSVALYPSNSVSGTNWGIYQA